MSVSVKFVPLVASALVDTYHPLVSSKITDCNKLVLNWYLPMNVTLLGIVTLVKPTFKNAHVSILVTLFGIVTSVSASQLSNIDVGITVTPYGMLILVSALHP